VNREGAFGIDSTAKGARFGSLQYLKRFHLPDADYQHRLRRSIPGEIQNLLHSEAQQEADSLKFTAYYTNPVIPNAWYSKHLYIFHPSAQDAVLQDAENMLNCLCDLERWIWKKIA